MHEETFLDGCLNDLAKINKSRNIEKKEKEETRSAACASASLPRVQEPGGSERQERKDAVSGQEDGNQETSDKLEGSKAKQKGDHPQLEEDRGAEMNNVKSGISYRLANFATLPNSNCGGHTY